MASVKPLTLAAAEIPANRALLPVTWARYVPGDYPGLHALAGELYGFAGQCNEKVGTLTGYVNNLVGEDRFSGGAADAFMDSYGVDAAIINGLDRVVCAMAGVIDTLAQRLAGLEVKVEAELQKCYEKGIIIHDGLGPDGPNFKANPKYGTASSNPASQLASVLMQRLQQHRAAAEIQAATYRATAATELAAMTKIVSSGLDYYLRKDGFNGVADPGGLLTTPQLTSDRLGAGRLEQHLTAEELALADAGVNWKNVADDLRTQNGNMQTVGAAVHDIKDLRSATGLLDLLKKGQQAADEAGPAIAIIGTWMLG